MLAEDPKDLFLRYSLAMELAKEGDSDASVRRLRELTKEDPPYVPAFFMAGQQLAQHSQLEQARTILREGIEQARQQGDLHAAGEMSEFLVTLGTADP
jgi:thioredoxin-like negative regulator of GroEL